MQKRTFLPLAAAALLAGAVVAEAEAAGVGDKAPALEVKEWIQGEPLKIEDGAGKKVFLVEFWAVTSEDSKNAIPHLTELLGKYGAQGLEIVAITDDSPDDVRAFLKDTKVPGRVGVDDNLNTVGSYRGRKGRVPWVFLVDKAGMIAWQGHPGNVDAPLEKVLAGKFDVAVAKEVEALRQELFRIMQGGNIDAIGAAVDKILDKDPTDTQAIDVKFQTIEKRENPDPAAMHAFVRQLLPKINDDWRALNAVAWKMATDENLAFRDIVSGFKAAKRGVELTQEKNADVLDSLARTFFAMGLLDRAIETQKKALALDAEGKGLKDALAYYESCLAAQKEAGPPPKPPAPPKGGKKGK